MSRKRMLILPPADPEVEHVMDAGEAQILLADTGKIVRDRYKSVLFGVSGVAIPDRLDYLSRCAWASLKKYGVIYVPKQYANLEAFRGKEHAEDPAISGLVAFRKT